MSSYIDTESILNRYRPRDLRTFMGNQGTKDLFEGLLLRGEVRQGFLVSGAYGCGKTSFAAAAARATACQNRTENSLEPCGRCGACDFSIRGYAAFGGGITYRTCIDYTIADLEKDLNNTLYSRERPTVLILDEFHRTQTRFHEVLLRWLDDDTVGFALFLCTVAPDEVELPLAQRLVSLPIEPPPIEELLPLLVNVCRQEGFVIDEDTLRRICAEEGNVPRTCLKRIMLHAVSLDVARRRACP